MIAVFAQRFAVPRAGFGPTDRETRCTTVGVNFVTIQVRQPDVCLTNGGGHLFQCLIVGPEVVGAELICRVKQATSVSAPEAVDFVRDKTAPVALIADARMQKRPRKT